MINRVKIFFIILLIFSCGRLRPEEKINEVYNRIKVTNPLLFRSWEISTRSPDKVSFHYIDSNKVLYNFVGYKEGNTILVKKITAGKVEQPYALQEVKDSYFHSINGTEVVNTFFKLKIDDVAYSSLLNGVVFRKGRIHLAYLFQPIDSAILVSTYYKSLDDSWYCYVGR
ncbi:hypothetical protein [Chitinophaga silvisoli]|uniref:Lipoprotein n=1 Tax=Chitinophaga silvisoli TaxID=2291814 RepID=A0A3E1NMW6_9BACT|nr:hypothetical protein [Chitinophaga silvisoli]RFM29276.1 hypothetical protein DXN04_33565 [Chitinophaga silvisoli]